MRAMQMKNDIYIRSLAENPQVHIGLFCRLLPFHKETFFIDNRDYVRMEIAKGIFGGGKQDVVPGPSGYISANASR